MPKKVRKKSAFTNKSAKKSAFTNKSAQKSTLKSTFGSSEPICVICILALKQIPAKIQTNTILALKQMPGKVSMHSNSISIRLLE